MSRLGEGSLGLRGCKDALAILRTVPDIYFGRPATEGALARAESALGLELPPSLRHFAATVGKCEVGTHEILGLQGDDFATDAAVNVVGATLLERKRGLPVRCIVVESEDDGARLVLDTERGYMVRRWSPGGGEAGLSDQVFADFGAYLLSVAAEHRPDDPEPTREEIERILAEETLLPRPGREKKGGG